MLKKSLLIIGHNITLFYCPSSLRRCSTAMIKQSRDIRGFVVLDATRRNNLLRDPQAV